MSIHIKNINVKNLGPIPELVWNLSNLNLVYGDNERGKSFLVEFLIRCLFKKSGWNLRKKTGTGRIEVEGLSDEIVGFTPGSSQKLEDFLTDKYIGLPPDFSKLLVLRGTNVELGEEEESDKIMLRRYLSHKEILDKIMENAQETVKNCSISSGYRITGDNRGRLKTRKELESKLKRIEELFTDVGNKFLGGEMKALEDKKKRLSEKYNNLEKAKRWKAYQLSEKIKELKEKVDKIDEEKIDELISNVNKLKDDKREFDQDKQEFEKLKELTHDYEWLDKAIGEYEKYNLGEITPKPSKWYLVSMAFMIILSVILMVFELEWFGFELKWFGIVTLLASVAIGFFYRREIFSYVEDTSKREELQSLKEGFRERFGEKLNNLAVMYEKKESMEGAYHRREMLEENLVNDEKSINSLELKLSEEISDLLKEEVEEDEWKGRLKEEERRKRNLEKGISNKRSELSGLQVDEEDYLRSKPEVKFDWDEYNEVKEELKKVKDEIQDRKGELEILKHSIIEHTKDEPIIEWMELIEKLASKRKEILEEYKEITSEIIANKSVYDVIDELYKQEDEKIQDALNSDIIKEILPKVTTHYEDIYLEDDRLMVSDPFDSFPVSEISDGAKEQVFLSLRVGFAEHWFNKNKLFLILDDAFLHSDYKRRPKLVDKTLELVDSGWQIICFTFDKNVVDIFKSRTKKRNKKLSNYFGLINLNEI